MPFMVAAAQSGSSSFQLLLLLLPFLLIALMFFSQRRRAQATQRAQDALSVGDEVRTTSGLFGTLRGLDEQTGHVEVAPGVVVRFDRRALLPVSMDPALGGAAENGAASAGSDDEPGETR